MGSWSEETFSVLLLSLVVTVTQCQCFFNVCMYVCVSVSSCHQNFTLPVAPTSPPAPRIKKTTLRSHLITLYTYSFSYIHTYMHACIHTGGSAITAFQIHLKNIDKEITLSRSVISYLWANLFPVPIISHAYIHTYIHT